ncbi:MAG: PrsW family glutamic-type intramembrane protease [Minisyncoccia bacterium]|jgi:RsiW-degrading membrane proteinase PrsW (M82 family)
MVATLNFLFVVILALLPAILWMIFFLKEDRHPEPKRLILFTFCAGALASIPVLVLQVIFQKFIAGPINVFLVLVLGLAVIEEIFKFFAAYWSVWNEPAFDEPVDAMIYTIAAALGFATIENIFIMGDKLDYLSLTNFITTLSALGFRFIGATLLHGLASAFAGFYWAIGRRIGKVGPKIILGIGIATAIHFVFNYLIYRFEDVSLFYPSLFLIFAAFFVFHDFSKLKTKN